MNKHWPPGQNDEAEPEGIARQQNIPSLDKKYLCKIYYIYTRRVANGLAEINPPKAEMDSWAFPKTFPGLGKYDREL